VRAVGGFVPLSAAGNHGYDSGVFTAAVVQIRGNLRACRPGPRTAAGHRGAPRARGRRASQLKPSPQALPRNMPGVTAPLRAPAAAPINSQPIGLPKQPHRTPGHLEEKEAGHSRRLGRDLAADSLCSLGFCARLALWRDSSFRCSSRAASGDSIEQVDGGRDRESERRHDPGQLAAVLVGLGHHRVREHGEDRTCREGKNEGDGAW
jgi:hypothetical protein